MKKGTAANRARAMMGAKGRDLKPHGHCHRTRGYKPSRVPLGPSPLSSSLSLAFATSVQPANGVLEYTPRVIYTSRHLAIDPWGPALSYTLYIRGAFTILATGPGQVLFFIDSFERGRCRHFKSRADF